MKFFIQNINFATPWILLPWAVEPVAPDLGSKIRNVRRTASAHSCKLLIFARF